MNHCFSFLSILGMLNGTDLFFSPPKLCPSPSLFCPEDADLERRFLLCELHRPKSRLFPPSLLFLPLDEAVTELEQRQIPILFLLFNGLYVVLKLLPPLFHPQVQADLKFLPPYGLHTACLNSCFWLKCLHLMLNFRLHPTQKITPNNILLVNN